MTAEQLQAARAAHWRQQQNPLLTLDDATLWFEQHPLSLYLPRRTQLPAPAPSFVEATLGRPEATPAPAAIIEAHALVTRLIEPGGLVGLNLFGAVGEQPDFLVASSALPYVLCLRADADWKHAPEKSSGHKVSPLVLELWKALEEKGALTAAEARETLGRELTEAAVLRGLCELWQGLRISPVYGETGQPARWELLRARHRDALAKAGSTSQVTALSLLVSIYLQSVYAATSEQIEIFLSPLASRSRVREAVRGLSATRQIHSLSMDAETYYFLEDGLPEFAQAAPSIEAVEPPRRPVQPDRRVARPETRSPARDARKPHWQEGSAAGQPPFPAARHFAPAPSREKSPHGPSATGSRPYRAARPAPGVGRPTGSGGKPGPARPAAGGGWKTPPRAPGKPAVERPSVPARGNFPPRVGQGAEGMAREPGRTGGPGRPGPQKRSQPWTGDKRKERPAPWVRAGAKPRSGPDSPPPFRAPGKPGADRPNRTGRTFERTFDRKPGGRPDRPDRPGGQRRDRPRPSGTVAGGPPGAAGTSGRAFGRPSVPGRSQPRRPDRPNRPDRPDRPDRPGGAPRSSRPDSRPPRPGSPRSGPPRSGPPRSGPPRSGPPRPGSPRSGEGQPARPPLRSSSRPGPSGPRAGASSGRPTGRPGGRPAGRPAGRPGGKPGGRPGKGPANFRGRKPTGKKPGA